MEQGSDMPRRVREKLLAENRLYANQALAQEGAAVAAEEPSRSISRIVLLERAERLERQARGLRALAAALPEALHRLSPEADGALWELLTSRNW